MNRLYEDFLERDDYIDFSLDLSRDQSFMITGFFDRRFHMIDMQRF